MKDDDKIRFCIQGVRPPKDRPEWCPLIELPDHGDLMEKDLALAIVNAPATTEAEFVEKMRMVQTMIAAPVVIPAERGIDKWWERSETVNAERNEE